MCCSKLISWNILEIRMCSLCALQVLLLSGIICDIHGIQETCYQWVSSYDSKFRSHCYWFNSTYPDRRSAFDANHICEENNGQLASYIDEDQFAVLTTVANGHQAWIGQNDLRHEGQYVTWDGELSAENFHNYWRPGNPNGDRIQNCVEVTFSINEWQDRECMETNQYSPYGLLCYRDASQTDTHCFPWTNDEGDVKESCYWIANFGTPMTLFGARDTCMQRGHDLAPIINATQLNYLRNILRNKIDSTAISGTDPKFYTAWVGLQKWATADYENMDGSPYETVTLSPCSSGECGCVVLECVTGSPCVLKETDCETTSGYWALCSRNDYVPASSSAPSLSATTSCEPSAPTAASTETRTTDSSCTCPNSINSTPTWSYSTSSQAATLNRKTLIPIKRKNTELYRRSLTCASDDRISAKGIGYLGVSVLCMVVGMVIFADCSKYLSRNIKSKKIQSI